MPRAHTTKVRTSLVQLNMDQVHMVQMYFTPSVGSLRGSYKIGPLVLLLYTICKEDNLAKYTFNLIYHTQFPITFKGSNCKSIFTVKRESEELHPFIRVMRTTHERTAFYFT